MVSTGSTDGAADRGRSTSPPTTTGRRRGRWVEEHWGGLDVLVNNAGVAGGGRIDVAGIDEWQWIIEINLLGVVRGCRTFTPMFKRQRSGRIVNVASLAGLVHPAGMASYNAVKAGVVALTETLGHELAPYGVQASVVCPSYFRTNLMASLRGADEALGAVVTQLVESSPFTADEIAAAVLAGIDAGDEVILPDPMARAAYDLKLRDRPAYDAQLRRQAARLDELGGPADRPADSDPAQTAPRPPFLRHRVTHGRRVRRVGGGTDAVAARVRLGPGRATSSRPRPPSRRRWPASARWAAGRRATTPTSRRGATWCARRPHRRRAAVVLRVLEDRTDAEIAEVLGCSQSAARRHVAAWSRDAPAGPADAATSRSRPPRPATRRRPRAAARPAAPPPTATLADAVARRGSPPCAVLAARWSAGSPTSPTRRARRPA